MKAKRGLVLILVGAFGLLVVYGVQRGLATMGAPGGRVLLVGVIGNVLCWVFLIGGMLLGRADRRRAGPPGP